MSNILFFIASIFPTTLFLSFIYYKHRTGIIITSSILMTNAFLLGLLIIFPIWFSTVYINNIFDYFDIYTKNICLFAFNTSFFYNAIPEETLKWVISILLFWYFSNFKEKFDGLVIAVLVSLGYATAENIEYVFVFHGGIETAIVRAYTAVPAHVAFGVTMGYFLSLAKLFPIDKTRFIVLSIVVPILFHGFSNFLIYVKRPPHSELSFLLFITIGLTYYGFNLFLWLQAYRKINRISVYER